MCLGLTEEKENISLLQRSAGEEDLAQRDACEEEGSTHRSCCGTLWVQHPIYPLLSMPAVMQWAGITPLHHFIVRKSGFLCTDTDGMP